MKNNNRMLTYACLSGYVNCDSYIFLLRLPSVGLRIMWAWFSRCCDGDAFLLCLLLVFFYFLVNEWKYIKYKNIETKVGYLICVFQQLTVGKSISSNVIKWSSYIKICFNTPPGTAWPELHSFSLKLRFVCLAQHPSPPLSWDPMLKTDRGKKQNKTHQQQQKSVRGLCHSNVYRLMMKVNLRNLIAPHVTQNFLVKIIY